MKVNETIIDKEVCVQGETIIHLIHRYISWNNKQDLYKMLLLKKDIQYVYAIKVQGWVLKVY